MVYVVIIIPIVDDDLVVAALYGKICLIYLLSGIVFVCHTNQFYQFLFISWSVVEF